MYIYVFFQGFINLKNDINSNIEFKLSIEANDALKLSGILWKCCIRHTYIDRFCSNRNGGNKIIS